MSFANLTESTKDTYLEYIQRNLPEGVAMKVTLDELKRLPQNIQKTMEWDRVNEEAQDTAGEEAPRTDGSYVNPELA